MTETTSPFDRDDSPVGRAESRPNAQWLVTGRGNYTDDMAFKRLVHAAFVRSPYAHARIDSIDTGAAEKAPGVIRIMTGAQLAEMCTPWLGTLTSMEGMKSAKQHAMAVDRVCWQGEPVACVVAQTRAEAEDAAELVSVAWTELPVTADKETALDPSTPVIHPDLGDNLAFRRNIDTGDTTAAMAAADVIVEGEFVFGRHTGVTLEPRAIVAEFEPATRRMVIHTSSQVPHMIRAVFAKLLGLKEHDVRVVAPDVGGSFGLKIHTYGDEVATAAMAMVLGRPVKFIADRLESFVTDIHAREHRIKAKMALTKAGDITAVELDDLAGVGAYSQYPRTSAFEAHQVLNITAGPYKHANYRAQATVVYLNKVPTSQYRAVGHPIGITVAEGLVDMAAAKLGMDPIEIRRRNVMEDNSYPRITASGIPVKDLSHQACIDVLVARMNYDALRAEQAELRAKGIHRGIGIAAFIKGTAPSPAGYYGAGGAPIVAQDATTLRLEPDGGVMCLTGVTEQGQGADTVMAQIAATAIGVPLEDIRVISGDTDATPYGGGTYASRATAIGGEATWQAGRALRAEILMLAGQLLQADPATLDVRGRDVVDAADGTQRMPLTELGRIAHYQPTQLPNDINPELQVTRHFRFNDVPYIFTNGIHGAVVELDVDTGFFRLLKHWVIEDCGRMINPLLADEQIRGGAVQGLGGALYEHCIYDDQAQLQNGTLADYLTPMATEMPDIEVGHVQTPTTESELGAKGAGESGTGAAPAAVLNAVNDALLPFGARVFEQPISPEVVLKALGRI
jgi:carbon-monoxide dehydrogenase large subunit